MSDLSSNDNQAAAALSRAPDAHGQAAMLLVESLLHGLIARSIVSVEDAIDIVDVAAEVKVEVAAEAGEPVITMERSLTILQTVKASLSNDAVDNMA